MGEREQKGSKAEKDLCSVHRKKGQNWDCSIISVTTKNKPKLRASAIHSSFIRCSIVCSLLYRV